MNLRFNGEVRMLLDKVSLEGELILPQEANGIVVFSHGSGSSRFSPRNKKVAQRLHVNQIGTFLFDLLTPEEDRNMATRFDIELLAHRLVAATDWLEEYEPSRNCRFGYFGASTGAAAALKAAAYRPHIKAVVSRGGRPDLAMEVLHLIQAPTLLIVGSLDYDVLKLNEQAFRRLTGEKKLEVVPGASHLFEEAGTLDKVATIAADWFQKYLTAATVT
jgi:putative phosphoribosyl transferase